MCVCLGLSEDGAFFLFASSRVFSVPRTSQNIESVFKCNGGLDEKCKYLPGSSLEKMKDLHSDVFSKVNWGLLVVFMNADQLGVEFSLYRAQAKTLKVSSSVMEGLTKKVSTYRVRA